MTSKEKLKLICNKAISSCDIYNIAAQMGLRTIQSDLEKDLDKLEEYEIMFNTSLEEIRKRLKVLEILKEHTYKKMYDIEEVEDGGIISNYYKNEYLTKEEYDLIKEVIEMTKKDDDKVEIGTQLEIICGKNKGEIFTCTSKIIQKVYGVIIQGFLYGDVFIPYHSVKIISDPFLKNDKIINNFKEKEENKEEKLNV